MVVGTLLLLMGLGITDWSAVLAGAVCELLGALMLVNPILVVQDGSAQVRNPLGMTVRRFPVSGPEDLRVEGKRLVHVATGKKVASLGLGVHKPDVERVRAMVPGTGSPG